MGDLSGMRDTARHVTADHARQEQRLVAMQVDRDDWEQAARSRHGAVLERAEHAEQALQRAVGALEDLIYSVDEAWIQGSVRDTFEEDIDRARDRLASITSKEDGRDG